MSFTELYLDTTDPNKLITNDIIMRVGVSIIFHTIVYAVFLNLVSYIFTGSGLSKEVNTRLIIFLLLVMTFGFIGRYYHVKDIYNAYNKDEVKTRNHLDKLYITWLFIS